MTLYKTIAERNPSEAVDFLRSKGVSIPTDINLKDPENHKKISVALADYVRQTGEDGLKEISQIHPDKEMFEGNFTGQNKLNADGKFKNCSGCPLSTSKNFCADSTTAPSATILSGSTINIAIIAASSIIVVGFIIFLFKK